MTDTRLTVRTATGATDDINVPYQEAWSVFDLKAHISQHHPLKPPVREQKLIHGGRLLLDEMPLKSIVTQGASLVLHLVISPVFLRTQSVPSTIPSWTAEERPQMEPAQSRLFTTAQSQLDLANAWQGAQPNTNPFPMHGGAGGDWPNPYLMTMPPYYAAQLAQWYQTAQGQGGAVGATGLPHNGGGVEEANADGVLADDALLLENRQQQDLELQQEEMAVMNPGGGLGMMAGQFPPRQRDLVDYLYMLMMMMFLGTIGYFTGSLHQFMIFFAGVAVILMNQGGWFTVQRRQAHPIREENANPRPREDEADTNNTMRQEEEAATPDEDEEGNEVDGTNQAPQAESQEQRRQTPPPPQDQPPNLGIIRTVAVFVTSFFTSLFPQHMPELEGI